jgi:Uma2 family endonuclease
MMINHTAMPTSGEQRVLLHSISWQTFETLLEDLDETRSVRLSYDQGDLEIMALLSLPHENDNRLIEVLIGVLVEELDLEIKRAGSVTCKREDLERGAEPDSCYYIQHEAIVRNKDKIDLNNDPPPDLVVEIEYSHSALPKLSLYAALGVPELWRYNGSELSVYQLVGDKYNLCQDSPTFSPIRVTEIPRFLRKSKQVGEVKMTKAFRQWIRKQRQVYKD